jgi:hypothetical protein
LLGPGPSSYKKDYLPGRGLTKVGKHCSREHAASVRYDPELSAPGSFKYAGVANLNEIHLGSTDMKFTEGRTDEKRLACEELI